MIYGRTYKEGNEVKGRGWSGAWREGRRRGRREGRRAQSVYCRLGCAARIPAKHRFTRQTLHCAFSCLETSRNLPKRVMREKTTVI